MITIESPLVRDAQYRVGIAGRAQVLLFLEHAIEAQLDFPGDMQTHLAAEMHARGCRRGDMARVVGTDLLYRMDHGTLAHVLRGVSAATVSGRELL